MLYKAWKDVIQFYHDYSSMMSESLYKSIEGKVLNILTPKQMLQRLPMAVAHVKAGNNSVNLLNKIRQIVHSLYQSNEITKKVYNNITKSIQI